MKLLRKLSPNLDRALAALLIGSMVTGVMKNHPTGLQITLGIKMRRSKNLQKYGVTCAYDEVRRLKNLAAKATTMEPSLPGLSTSSSSLVQVIVDNFDTDLILTYRLQTESHPPIPLPCCSHNQIVTVVKQSKKTPLGV